MPASDPILKIKKDEYETKLYKAEMHKNEPPWTIDELVDEIAVDLAGSSAARRDIGAGALAIKNQHAVPRATACATRTSLMHHQANASISTLLNVSSLTTMIIRTRRREIARNIVSEVRDALLK